MGSGNTNVRSRWTAGNLEFYEKTAGSGASVIFGLDASGLDVKFYGATASSYMLWDESADQLVFNAAHFTLGDDAELRFGDGATGDVSILWDGNSLNILPLVDDTGTIEFGDGTTDMDVKIFLGDTSNYVQFDVGNQKIYFVRAPDGENARTLHLDLEPTGAEMRRGAIQIEIWRSTDFTWAGSPDVGLKIEANSDATNASGGAIRSIDTTARNRGADITWVHGIHAGVRNDSGSTCPELIGLSTRVENYGTMATQMVGLDVNFSCESDTGGGSKTGILVRNTDASAQTAVDEVLKISHTSTNGFTYLVNFAGATGESVSTGTLTQSGAGNVLCDARIACVWNGTPYYIALYDTAP